MKSPALLLSLCLASAGLPAAVLAQSASTTGMRADALIDRQSVDTATSVVDGQPGAAGDQLPGQHQPQPAGAAGDQDVLVPEVVPRPQGAVGEVPGNPEAGEQEGTIHGSAPETRMGG